MDTQIRKKLLNGNHDTDEAINWTPREYADEELAYKLEVAKEKNDSYRYFMQSMHMRDKNGHFNPEFRSKIEHGVILI